MDRHDVDLLNNPVFLCQLIKTLKRGYSVKLVFHGIKKESVKQANFAEALAKAKEDFITNCPKIVNLKKEFPTKVHIYWIPFRLHDHCIIIAGQVVLREETQHSQDKYPELTVFNEKKLNKAWIEYFEKLISFDWVIEIDFEETSLVVEVAA